MLPTKIHPAHTVEHLAPTDQNAASGVPIFKLHRDLFWKIFMINADLDAVSVPAAGSHESIASFFYRFNALIIARRTSQVCNQWRDLMISSPSLWGRCIDLERLDQKQPHWRNEVLQRTGQSLLHVKGEIGTSDLANILLCILDTEWARIGTLDVGVYDESVVGDPKWSALQRPAPLLQNFFISFDGGLPDILSAPGKILFADHAPALVKFMSDDSDILFKSPPSWFSQIRHFDIRGTFTVPQLLDALSQMSYLEYIHIHQYSSLDTPPSSLRPYIIHFPHLGHVHLSSTFRACLTLLEHITPAPGCNLMFFAEDEDTFEIGNTELLTTLSRYARGCFNSNTPLELALELKTHNWLFRCKDLTSSREIFVSIDCNAQLPPQINDTFISLLSSGPFNKVCDLSIYSYYHNPTNIAFISLLPSVQTLDTSEIVLEALLTVSNEENRLFPCLKTLKCRTYHKLTLDFIRSFLFHRQKLGLPIEVLDIAATSLRPSFGDLHIFDEFTGLQVLWTEKGTSSVYSCGSGHFERSHQAGGLRSQMIPK